MNYLYIDNFRGFTNTYIPIKDVNFLVGENSTGKTSVLSLISLLGSVNFYLRQEFNTDDVELGRFSDIASNRNPEIGSFKIGVIECVDNDQSQKDIESFLMTFIERDQTPILSRYQHLSKRGQISFIFSKEGIRYKVSEGKYSCQSDIFSIFSAWVNDINPNLDEYKLQENIKFRWQETLFHIQNLIDKIYKETDSPLTQINVRIPSFSQNLTWLAPIRSRPRRTYDAYKIQFSPEGEHIPYLLKNILRSKKNSREFLQAIEKFGAASGLFESIFIKSYGKEVAAPFELHVVVYDKHLRINNVGYGVSQALPIIVEVLARPEGQWFAIQQPEVHLHPKAQSALGDLLYTLATSERKKFFVETHSDYTIDRFRLNIRNHKEQANLKSQVLFFEKNPFGNQVHAIPILENGEYSDDQPKSYRDFFIKEELDLLGF